MENAVPLICRRASTSPLTEETDFQSYAPLCVCSCLADPGRLLVWVSLGKAVRSPAQMRSHWRPLKTPPPKVPLLRATRLRWPVRLTPQAWLGMSDANPQPPPPSPGYRAPKQP